MENVEVVRRAFEAMARGDRAAILADFAADATIDFTDSRAPYAGTYQGHDGLNDLLDQIMEAWESFTWEAEDFIAIDDHVVVPLRTSMRGRGSGIDVESQGGAVYTVRNGRIVRYKQCQSKEEALAAAGMRT